MATLHELLSAEIAGEGAWRFRIPVSMHGAFGGAFGGMLGACTLIAARHVCPDRTPMALDCRFVRGLRRPEATAMATVLHQGRRLSNVSVDVLDEDGMLSTRASVSLADPGTLDGFATDGPAPGEWKSYGEVGAWPPVAPIVGVLDPRIIGNDERGIATAVRIPWSDEGHSAEAACMAGDMAVGPPLGTAAPPGVGTPNPDLSLRFCGDVTTPIVVGVGRLDRALGGVAATRVEVFSDGRLVATGVSSALLIPPSQSSG